MADYKHTLFIQSIKGKIIIAAVLACFTLLLAWSISNVTFKRLLKAVEKISTPNDKLRLVNDLTHKVAQLDQVQKAEALDNPANYYSLFKETKKLLISIDTLQSLFAGDAQQVKRIKSLRKLLVDRNTLFINYLKVREGLVNNKNFTNQVRLLNDLVNKSVRQNDSTTTENRTSTTTIIPGDFTDTAKSKGFFSKLFSKKKKQPAKPSYKVVHVESNVQHDTLAIATQDSILRGMRKNMHRLEQSQLQRSALFVNRETVLNKANNKLIKRILSILKQVESEAIAQSAKNNNAAKTVVSTSVTHISYIVFAFLLLTIILLYLIFTDISRGNRYKQELEIARDEAEYHGQAKHRFLSNMSHEIRTPLQSIIGYAELIKQQEHPSEKDVDAIYKSSEHLMQIVNEVLDYNRIISGKFSITKQPFNVADVLNEVTSTLQLQANKKSISLNTGYNIPLNGLVEGDAFRLKQILYNLLGNAIKFTDKGEVKLVVDCAEKKGFLNYVFTVTDTGIGLSGKDLTRIFNEFEQVPEPDAHHTKGTGLGLTISKALIEMQGGSISVKSEPGQGSAFTFKLSYKAVAEPGVELVKQPGILRSANIGTVWIIDDDNFILDLCSAIFERNGVPHRGFSSPKEVLDAEFDIAVKYILLDIRLPGMSGTELCKILRTRIPAGVSIFALTAQVLPGEREHILNEGFDGLLMKPFQEADLLKLVSPTIDTKENQPEIKLDISKVKKMTFGDTRQLNKILKRFTEDCIDDIAELRLSIGNNDHEKLTLLVHRIAGRVAQIGADELASDFRLAELDLRENEQLSNDRVETIISLTAKLQMLVKQIRSIYLDDELAKTTV